MERTVEVAGDFLHRLIQLAVKVALRFFHFRHVQWRRLSSLCIRAGCPAENIAVLPDAAPDAGEEAVGTFDRGVVPLGFFFRRADEEGVEAYGVGAVVDDQLVRADDVAFGFAHFVELAVDVALLADHALREEFGERFVEADQAEVVDDLGEEAGVEQVQNGVFDAADILVDRQPVVGGFGVDRLRAVAGVEVAQEVPAGVDERVHRVGLAPRRFAALRAGTVHERGGAFERRLAGRLELDVGRQQHRQFVVVDRNHAAAVAIDDRNRRAPVALAGNQPVAQAEVDGAFAEAFGLGVLNHCADGLAVIQAGEFAGVAADAVFGVGVLHLGENQRAFRILDRKFDRQVVLLRESPVARVVRRDGHHRAGAVHQHIVADPQRNLFAGERIDDIAAGENAFLLERIGLAVEVGQLRAVGDKLQHFLFLRQAGDHLFEIGVFRRQHHVGAAVNGVHAGGEAGDFVRAVGFAVGARNEREINFRTFGAADPVALHRLDALRPAFELIDIVEQPLGVIGDFEKPLFERLLNHDRSAPVAASVDNLLVRQHGLVVRAPVDVALLLVGQPAVEHLNEKPLRPFVIFRLAGGHFLVPVVAAAPGGQLFLHHGDILERAFARRRTGFDRGVFGGQPERVPAHRRENIEAAHLFVADDGVADDVVAAVADVQLAGGIGEHHQAVILLRRLRQIGLEQTVLVPVRLPLRFNFRKRVFLIHRTFLA